MPMVPDAIARFDDDQVEAERQRWERGPVRQRPALEQPVRRGPHADTLAMVDGLLGQTEVAAATPPDLDDHERWRWPRIHGHEVDLAAADVDIPSEDGPARVR